MFQGGRLFISVDFELRRYHGAVVSQGCKLLGNDCPNWVHGYINDSEAAEMKKWKEEERK